MITAATLHALTTETTLEQAERRYRDALNRGADPVVVVDAGATLINELMVALHGQAAAS